MGECAHTTCSFGIPVTTPYTRKTKLCNKCKVNKQLTAFGRNSRNPDGLQYYCLDCMHLYQERLRLKRASKLLATSTPQAMAEREAMNKGLLCDPDFLGVLSAMGIAPPSDTTASPASDQPAPAPTNMDSPSPMAAQSRASTPSNSTHQPTPAPTPVAASSSNSSNNDWFGFKIVDVPQDPNEP